MFVKHKRKKYGRSDASKKTSRSRWYSLIFLIVLVILSVLLVFQNTNAQAQASAQNNNFCQDLCKKICTEADTEGSTCATRCSSLCSRLVKRRSTPISTPPHTSNTPTISITPTYSPSSTPAQQAGTVSYWHPPGSHDGLNIHEHGDPAPAWADTFSMNHFGHKVMYGGDEATNRENELKHQAYKGFTMRASGVDLFIRYHSMSMPTDRSGPIHSYEVYGKDSAGNVSFWQGHIFHGYPERRDQRMPRRNEQPGHDPHNGIDWPGRDQFIIAGSDTTDWERFLRCEQWYGHAGQWSWDLSITICGAATHFTVDEHLKNVYDPANWIPTGSVGASRRLEVTHYGPENPRSAGDRLPFDRWFCVQKAPVEFRATGATPRWNVSGAVSGPRACEAGWLPQYVADTFPKKGIYFETGNTAEKDFPAPGVVIPN